MFHDGHPYRPVKYFTLGGAQLCIGAAAIFARFALGGAGPLAVSALRLVLAALFVIAIVAFRRGYKRLDARVEILLAVAGTMLAIHFAAWIASLGLTSIAIGTLLVCTSPIFSGAYEAFASRRFPGVFFWVALALGALGLGLVVAAKGAPMPHGGNPLAGAALALLGAVAISAYLLIVRSVRSGLSTLDIVVRTYSWAAVALLVMALSADQSPPPLADQRAWFGILAMAIVSQLFGHTAINAALKHFTPTTIGFSTLLEPVIAAILGAIVFGENLPAQVLTGGFVLLGAIGFAIRDSASAPNASGSEL